VGLHRQSRKQLHIEGKGRCQDNTFIERLRRTVQYEYLYLHAFEDSRSSTPV
jgi:putative transposase